MRKRVFLTIGIAALTLAVCFMAACGNGTTGAGGTDEPLVYQDVVNGKVVEITISRTDPSRVVANYREGDFYVIRYHHVIVNRGRITKVGSNGQATFTPDADSPGPDTEFTGTFGDGSLSIPSIPIEGGSLTGVNATPGGGSGGGGGSGTPTPLPPGTGGGMFPTSPTEPGGDFEYRDVPGGVEIWNYLGSAKDVNIPATLDGKAVVSIGAYAFYEMQLTSVTIPDSVTIIGGNSFDGNQLTDVTIPDSVITIELSAFFGNQLTSVTIGNSVTTIEEYAFNSNQLTSVAIGNSVTTIGEAAFANNELNSVTIPENVKTIGEAAFFGNQLSSVTIPEGVTTIEASTFHMNQLTSVTIPESVTTIGELAFATNQLTSVEIPDSVTDIGDLAFFENQLSSVTIPDSVRTIGTGAFDNDQLTSVTIGANVFLDDYPFNNGFEEVYDANGKSKGTYTRPDAESFDWTKQPVQPPQP